METNLIKPSAGESGSRERLSQSMKNVVSESDLLLKSAQQVGQERLSAAGEQIESKLQSAQHRLSQVQATAIDRAKQVAQTTDEVVHTHPYTAIGVAAGVGALVGLLMARR